MPVVGASRPLLCGPAKVFLMNPNPALSLSGRNCSSCPIAVISLSPVTAAPPSGKLPWVPPFGQPDASRKRSSRRTGDSEDLPRCRQDFFRQGGILDRAGERHRADNSGEGGDGPPTPGGGGAPT